MVARCKLFLLLLAGLLSVTAPAQRIIGYRAVLLPDSTQAVYRKYDNGTLVRVANLPTDAQRGRFGGRVLLPYALETQPGVLNWSQFGTNKYFSPGFKFNIDLVGPFTTAERRSFGVNLFSNLVQPEAEKASFPWGDGIRAIFEQNILAGPIAGTNFGEKSLAEVEAELWNNCPALGYGNDNANQYVYFNFEVGVFWKKGSYLNNGTWEAKKNTSILCESDGQVRTLEQLDQQGRWDAEERVRIQHRYALIDAITRRKSKPGIKISWATGLYSQLYPNLDVVNSHGLPFEGNCDVSHIGGDNQGNITLNGRQYTLTGNIHGREDFQMGYNYLYNFDISRADYNDIWRDHKPGTQNYPYLWSKMRTIHIVAFEKAYWQLIRGTMQARFGRTWPIMRLSAPVYEGDGGIVDNNYANIEATRIPFAAMQRPTPPYIDQPKILQPPYLWYSRYVTWRFMEGDQGPGSGFYLFPINPGEILGDLSQYPDFKTVLHCYTALFQARHDMQPYETLIPGSNQIEDPLVQLRQTGAYASYTGTEAFAYHGGVTDTERPAYSIRWKLQADGSYRVLVLGGMNQDWTAERVDNIQAPNGALNGATFAIKLRGPAAHVYEFIVGAGEINQTYTAQFMAQTLWEKAGYAGRVGSATN